MSSVNKVLLVGRLGQDPEVRDANGTKCVTLSLATSDRWTDRNSGEKKERTEWHRVVIWGGKESDGLAGTAEKYLRKGSQCLVEGKLQTRKWTDQQGVDRYTTEVVLQGFQANLVLLDGKGEGGGIRPPAPSGPDDYGRSNSRPSGGGKQASAPFDDSIPF